MKRREPAVLFQMPADDARKWIKDRGWTNLTPWAAVRSEARKAGVDLSVKHEHEHLPGEMLAIVQVDETKAEKMMRSLPSAERAYRGSGR
jgi:hypothetical protein